MLKLNFSLLIILIMVLTVILGVGINTKGLAGEEESNLSLGIRDEEGVQLVSLRELAEEYNWDLYYVPTTKVVIIYNQSNRVELLINEAKLQGEKLSQAPQIIEGRTYIPLEIIPLLITKMGEEKVELLTSLSLDNNEYQAGELAIATITLYNFSSQTITLRYGSGQLYDLYLKDEKQEQELWRWSQDKFFTMALVQKELKAGEILEYEVEMEIPKQLEKGQYILTAKITTNPPYILNQCKINLIP